MSVGKGKQGGGRMKWSILEKGLGWQARTLKKRHSRQELMVALQHFAVGCTCSLLYKQKILDKAGYVGSMIAQLLVPL